VQMSFLSMIANQMEEHANIQEESKGTD
jgi:hypothetical protein